MFSSVALFFLAGCLFDHDAVADPLPSKTVNFVVKLDNSFTTTQKEVIQRAGHDWSTSTNGAVVLEFVEVDPSNLQRTFMDEGIINVFNKTPGFNAAGWTAWNEVGRGAYIDINPKYDGPALYAIVGHEFGHAFHLGHYAGSQESIMTESVGLMDHIPCRDVVAFCVEWKNCELPYCL